MTTYLAVICAVIAGFIISAAATGRLIPFLQKHQFKQFVREEGPQAHLSKTGTPSMGGLAITAASVLAALIIAAVSGVFSIRILVVCITMVLFGVIGFIDDYEKAIKKNNAGISPRQKIVLQFGFSLAFAIFAYFTSGTLTDGVAAGNAAHSSVWIPIWDHYLDIGILYIPWVMFVMIAFSNSVNLTDGLDGLASSVTSLVTFLMALVGYNAGFSDYPLFYAGIMMKLEIILAIAGLIYVMEALSVIIQVTYFKKTGGKRIFRMAPLHHHFELGGMHETKVVRLFATITLVFCIIAFLLSVI